MKNAANLIVIVFLLSRGQAQQDPCKTALPISHAEYRGTECEVTRTPICDRGGFRSGWYFSESYGTFKAMPEKCPKRASCGTLTPIWLNGKHPQEVDGEVERTACVRGLETNEYCNENITIKVKNCTNFYVYFLPETKFCDEAYCFGNERCPIDYTTVKTDIGLPPSDPCNIALPISRSNLRGINCLSNNVEHLICDRTLPERWYTADIIGVSLDMPQTCVPVGSCGTLSPIWLNGTIPRFNEGIVSRTACIRGLRSSECCKETTDIKIRNCGFYNVYYLKPVQYCDESYCFGSHSCVQEQETTTATNAAENNADKNIALYGIIGALMILLLVSLIVMYCIMRHKAEHGSKVDVKHQMQMNANNKDWITHQHVSAPPAYSKNPN